LKRTLIILCIALIAATRVCSQVSQASFRLDSAVQKDADSISLKLNDTRAGFQDNIPGTIERINDYISLFRPDQEQTLGLLFTYFEQQTKIPIALVTLDSTMIAKDEFEHTTFRFLDNLCNASASKEGILICISVDYRVIEIKNSRGIEKICSNVETKKLIESAFIPYFKKNDYFEGMLNGLKILQKRMKSRYTPAPQNGQELTLQ
jgi:uncharacterized protein